MKKQGLNVSQQNYQLRSSLMIKREIIVLGKSGHMKDNGLLNRSGHIFHRYSDLQGNIQSPS
jgi:hypothetical protein